VTSASAHVPADLAALGAVRSHIAEALADARWDSDASSRVLIASTEAFANALEHGSAPGAGVDVAFTVTDDNAWVWVRDSGRPGREAPLDDPTAPAVTSTGGRGRLLMRALADQMLVRRRGQGTEVRLGFGRDAAVC
jgi:serine/threonine-protein kinase RsbW